MSKQFTASNGSGGRIPNFAAFGLKDRAVQKAQEVLGRLWESQNEAGREINALDDRIRELADSLHRARLLSYLGRGEPSAKEAAELEEQKARRELLARDLGAMRGAVDLGKADLYKAVRAVREGWLEQLEAGIAEDEATIARLEHELAVAHHGRACKEATHGWCRNPEGDFGVPPSPGAADPGEAA